MKKVFKFPVLIILLLIAACAVFSACSFGGGNGGGNGGNNGGNGGETEAKDYGVWNEYDGVKLAYIGEKDFDGGNVNPKKVFSELTCKTGETYFMVVDFQIQAPADNDGTDTVTAAVQVKPATVLSAKLQETNSANFSETKEDGVTEIKATYKIPEKADTARDMRLIIKLETLQNSEAYIGVSFRSDGGVKAVKTEELEQTASIGFTKGLVYSETDGAYTVTGLGEAADGEIVLPLLKDGIPVEAICRSAVCESEVSTVKPLEETGRVLIKEGKCLLNADKTEVVFGCGTDELPVGVTGISRAAYAECAELTGFSVPSGVKVADGAFRRCDNLQSMTLSTASLGESGRFGGLFGGSVPASLKSVTVVGTSVAKSAFERCGTIENITLSKDITSIGTRAFFNCGGLSAITLPDGLTSIGNEAFYGSGITGVTIPASMTTVGSQAFWNCKKLKSVSIPNGVKSIESDSFNGCISLTSVTIPDSVTEIGSAAFKNCTALTRVALPKNITEIKPEAFSGCSGLTSISIPASVQVIGDSAFDSCTALTGLTVPDGVTKIMDNAFNGCYKIENITLPKSLMQIGRYAFRNSLWGDITYRGTKAEWKAIDKLDGWKYGIVPKLYCTDGTMQTWEI